MISGIIVTSKLREPLSDKLNEYAQQDCHIRFVGTLNNRGDSKLGINPKYGWSNPIGIYTYPLVDILKYARKSRFDGIYSFLRNYFPFMPGTNMYVVKPSVSPHRLIYLSDYTMAELESDRLKLKHLYSRLLGERFDMPSAFSDIWEAVFTHLPNEKAFSVLWNFTAVLSDILFVKYSEKNNLRRYVIDPLDNCAPNAIQWAGVLKRLDIYGLIDPGYGILHHAESCQAWFLTAASLKTVDLINLEHYNKENMHKLVSSGKSLYINKNYLPIILEQSYDNAHFINKEFASGITATIIKNSIVENCNTRGLTQRLTFKDCKIKGNYASISKGVSTEFINCEFKDANSSAYRCMNSNLYSCNINLVYAYPDFSDCRLVNCNFEDTCVVTLNNSIMKNAKSEAFVSTYVNSGSIVENSSVKISSAERAAFKNCIIDHEALSRFWVLDCKFENTLFLFRNHMYSGYHWRAFYVEGETVTYEDKLIEDVCRDYEDYTDTSVHQTIHGMPLYVIGYDERLKATVFGFRSLYVYLGVRFS